MKEWRQTITVICTVVLAFAALAALMQFEHAAIRAEMRSGHAHIREEMGLEHAQMREEMSREHAAIRAQLNSIDRRTARIEDHLFGIKNLPGPADGLDNQRLEFGGVIGVPDADPAREMIEDGAHDLVAQDEIYITPPYSHRSDAAVIEGLEARFERTNVILAGSDAKPALCDFADLISETRTVKHDFDAGIKALLCIDFQNIFSMQLHGSIRNFL